MTPWNSQGTRPKWRPSRPLCVIRITSADSNAGTDVDADLDIVFIKTEGKNFDFDDLSLARPQKTFAFEDHRWWTQLLLFSSIANLIFALLFFTLFAIAISLFGAGTQVC